MSFHAKWSIRYVVLHKNSIKNRFYGYECNGHIIFKKNFNFITLFESRTSVNYDTIEEERAGTLKKNSSVTKREVENEKIVK